MEDESVKGQTQVDHTGNGLVRLSLPGVLVASQPSEVVQHRRLLRRASERRLGQEHVELGREGERLGLYAKGSAVVRVSHSLKR
jgi:hypothetical protein